MILKPTAAATAKANPFMLHHKKIVVDFSEVEKALNTPENVQKINYFHLLDFSENSLIEAFKTALIEELENGIITNISDFAFFEFYAAKIACFVKINFLRIASYKEGSRKYNVLKIRGFNLVTENGVEINYNFSQDFYSRIEEVNI